MSRKPGLDILAVFLDIGFLLENTSVYQSQVGDQFVALSKRGYSVGLLIAIQDQEKFQAVLGNRLSRAGIQVHSIPERGFFRNLLQMSSMLRRIVRSQPVRHAYVRGIWGAVIIALAGLRPKLPYVFDVRGDLQDELIASGSPRYKRAIYRTIERWSINGAAKVSAVTRALAEVISDRYRPKSINVVPCCIDPDAMTASDTAASARRQALGYDKDHLVLVYSGGLSHYQQVPAMLAMWRQLLDDPNIRFLLLTNDDPHKSTAVVGDLSDFGARLQHRSLPRAEVPATLASADIGFMLRDGRLLNRVASPVKFPEYLCAGLAVVGSPGTGDASELIETHRLGVLVDPHDVNGGVTAIRKFIASGHLGQAGFRHRVQMVARTHYDWRSQGAVFAALYGRNDVSEVL